MPLSRDALGLSLLRNPSNFGALAMPMRRPPEEEERVRPRAAQQLEVVHPLHERRNRGDQREHAGARRRVTAAVIGATTDASHIA